MDSLTRHHHDKALENNNAGHQNKNSSYFFTHVIRPWSHIIHNRDFLFTLLLGQYLSLMITCSSVSTEILKVKYNLELPGIQTFVAYFLLTLVFLPIFIYSCYMVKKPSASSSINTTNQDRRHVESEGGSKEDAKLPSSRNYKFLSHFLPYYFLAALFDYEANFLVVTSISYISVLNMTLILCLTTPMVMLLSICFLKSRFSLLHYIGVMVAIGGVCLIVFIPEAKVLSSLPDDQRMTALSWKGHLICAVGALFYAISNLFQEYLVRKNGTLPYLALIGFIGVIISIIQNILILGQMDSYIKLFSLNYDCAAFSFICLYGFSLLLFYSLSPVFFNRSTATLFNLSLLTSNLYIFILCLLIFDDVLSIRYIGSLVVVLAGLLLFNVASQTVPCFSPSTPQPSPENDPS